MNEQSHDIISLRYICFCFAHWGVPTVSHISNRDKFWQALYVFNDVEILKHSFSCFHFIKYISLGDLVNKKVLHIWKAWLSINVYIVVTKVNVLTTTFSLLRGMAISLVTTRTLYLIVMWSPSMVTVTTWIRGVDIKFWWWRHVP